ncbi:MAG: PilZ domain-containing protein [Thermoanaerobaculia bacterium]
MHDAVRNLRTAERYLLTPPLAATFGGASVAVCDISAKGARFRHDRAIENGAKAVLRIVADGTPAPISIEATVVWTQSDPMFPGKFLSGVRTYGPAEVLQSLLVQLQTSHRTKRVEELRSTDRFYLSPSIDGEFDLQRVKIENLSARGARLELLFEPLRGSVSTLRFAVPDSEIAVEVSGQVMWTQVKAITGSTSRSFRAGLLVNEKPELIRLAIGHLCDAGRAALDTHSLRLKLKIIRARARQLAPSYAQIEASGIPAEQYLLIQGVREELRLNPEEAMHWYRRARLIINDPATRIAAPPIAHHPDALAVWEYLDRSIDPSIVSRAFELE